MEKSLKSQIYLQVKKRGRTNLSLPGSPTVLAAVAVRKYYSLLVLKFQKCNKTVGLFTTCHLVYHRGRRCCSNISVPRFVYVIINDSQEYKVVINEDFPFRDPSDGGCAVTHTEPLTHQHQHLKGLTQFTGGAHPSAATCAFSIGLVAGGSVLAQTALPTVCSIKPCRAFWEKNHTDKTTVWPLVYLSFRWSLCSGLCPLTFCAVGSSPARCAHAPAAGRVADAIITAATGLVTSFPIGPGWACCQERDKQYLYLFMNSTDQKWKFHCLVSDTGHTTGNIKSVLSHVWLGWVFPNNFETKRVFVPLWVSVTKMFSVLQLIWTIWASDSTETTPAPVKLSVMHLSLTQVAEWTDPAGRAGTNTTDVITAPAV